MCPQQIDAFDGLLERARRLSAAGGAGRAARRVLGIAGPPGAGKSTLAARVVELLGPDSAVLVPMDGFHLAQAELARLGRADRKGAPDTFDAAGYAALLRRVRAAEPGTVVYAPAFDRDLEEAIAGSVPVPPDVPLVVTEGNYLLHDDPAWAPVRPLLDEAWFLDPDPALRVARLIERHVRHGRPRPEAQRWVMRSDEANTRLVARGRDRADVIVADAVTRGDDLTTRGTKAMAYSEDPGEGGTRGRMPSPTAESGIASGERGEA